MKRILSLGLTALLLSACGAQDPADDTQVVRTKAIYVRQVSLPAPTAVSGERRSYAVSYTAPTLLGKSRVPILLDFSLMSPQVRLQDISLTHDVDGLSGDLYRLYQAAFARVPDVRGFGYWKNVVETGGSSLDQVAVAFLQSAESQTLYGAGDDFAFVATLYKNVLGRTADATEIAYWVNAIKLGSSRPSVLMAFAKSPENAARTFEKISQGMAFAEPGVAYIPVADSTGPNEVPVSVGFDIDGSSSTDANDDPISYVWSIVSQPATGAATIVNKTAAKARVTLAVPGTYEIDLWVKDPTSMSYSASRLTITAYSIVADSSTYRCQVLDIASARNLYARGHTYLDRDKDGRPCEASDIAFEMHPPVAPIVDSGIYTCSTISQALAFQLYLQGHTYLDRDKDGKPCEATDIAKEVVVTPPVVAIPRTCYVNGYRRSNGTYVSGYWRRC